MSALPDPAHRATGRPASAWQERSVSDAGQAPVEANNCHERVEPIAEARRPDRSCPLSRRGRGPGRPGLQALHDELTARDFAVLDLVADHRFMTTHQLEQFCFADHASPASGARSCRRVLARLERDRLLERPIRRIGGLQAGSASSIWMLTSLGQRLRAMRSGRGAVGRVRPPGERFIAHYLAIGDVRLWLVNAERARRLVILQVQIEPSAWRTFSGPSGMREVLKPDLSAVTAPAGDAEFEDHWFLEVDRGTESIPTLLKQCRAYEAYRRSGLAQEQHGVFPLVAWIVPDQTRAARLRAAISGARELNNDLYRVVTFDELGALFTPGSAGGPA